MIPQIIIYSPQITNRLRYTCHVIFTNLMGVGFLLVDNETGFQQLDGAKINYSTRSFLFPTLHILPAGLLFESSIQQQRINVGKMKGEQVLFPTETPGYYPFDIFSAVFFMVSRYEEYLPFAPDQFGRFTEAQSISGKNGFTEKPVVNIWVKFLAENISKLFQSWQPPQKKGSILFTYDIDVAYAFRGRRLRLHLLSLAKDILYGRFANVKAKFTSRFGQKNDPFDTYPLIFDNPITKHFFFLLALKKGEYDNNIPPESTDLKQLIQSINKKYEIGIHPSFYSTDNKQLLENEISVLEEIVGTKVTTSRQHYLRLRFPTTYRQLIEAGINQDYSLAYAEKPGFRAGICSPFPFFDLINNKATHLILHPTCIMDSCFRDDLRMTAAQSLPIYKQLLQTVLSFGGEFVCIWHNDMLAERAEESHPLNFRKTYMELTEEVMRTQNLD